MVCGRLGFPLGTTFVVVVLGAVVVVETAGVVVVVDILVVVFVTLVSPPELSAIEAVAPAAATSNVSAAISFHSPGCSVAERRGSGDILEASVTRALVG